NDGKIRSVQVPATKPPGNAKVRGGLVRVWLLADAKAIAARRRDRGARKKADPTGSGCWVSDAVFQLTRDMGPSDPPTGAGLRAGNLVLRDEQLAEDAGVSNMAPVGWRRHPQPGLDLSLNGGRLRHLRVCSRSGRMVIVSARADVEKIIE